MKKFIKNRKYHAVMNLKFIKSIIFLIYLIVSLTYFMMYINKKKLKNNLK